MNYNKSLNDVHSLINLSDDERDILDSGYLGEDDEMIEDYEDEEDDFDCDKENE